MAGAGGRGCGSLAFAGLRAGRAGLYGRVCSMIGVLPAVGRAPDLGRDALGWLVAGLDPGPGGNPGADAGAEPSSAAQAAAEASA